MILTDTVTLDANGARITRDGYLVAEALVGRANNIQTYSAGELGLTDRDPGAQVRVFRPEAEVFAKDALASLAGRPVTVDHPPVMVDAKNWREYAKGDVAQDVLRDGEFIRVPFKVMDASGVTSILNDHQEFSLGYQVELDHTPGVHDGQAYDSVARHFRYNHLAAVRAARGGSALKITDERPNPTPEKPTVALKTLTFDGVPIADVSDAAEAVINKLVGQLTAAATAKDAAASDVVRLTAEAVAKDAEIVTLKAAADAAKITPAKLRDAAKAYATVIAKAKALGATVTDEMDEIAVKKAVVSAKMGDAAKSYTDEHIGIAFDTLTAGVKIGDTAADPIAALIGDGVATVGDAAAKADKAYADHRNSMRDAWKTPAATH